MYMTGSKWFHIFPQKNGQKLMVGNHQNVHEPLGMFLHFSTKKWRKTDGGKPPKCT